MMLAHLRQVCLVEAQVHGSLAWSRGAFVSELNDPLSGLWVCEEDACGEVCGYLVLMAVASEGHLTNLTVRPSRRRCGIGRALLGCALDHARAWELSQIFLEVRPSNLAATSLYEDAGFKSRGRRPNYYADNGEDALIMSYSIRGSGAV
jgi:ribosomal-protein-alanine N-acetyltransferase